MQAINDLFLRGRLHGKVSALIVEIREFQKLSGEFSFEVQRKSNNFPRNPEDDNWRKYLHIGLRKEVQYSV